MDLKLTHLSSEEVLKKKFKTAMRGYNQNEVDEFLDLIIEDYQILEKKVEELQFEVSKYKRQVEDPTKRSNLQQTAGTTNFDILKRLSNLERHVFGNKLDE